MKSFSICFLAMFAPLSFTHTASASPAFIGDVMMFLDAKTDVYTARLYGNDAQVKATAACQPGSADSQVKLLCKTAEYTLELFADFPGAPRMGRLLTVDGVQAVYCDASRGDWREDFGTLAYMCAVNSRFQPANEPTEFMD